jgi:hypothetical protein
MKDRKTQRAVKNVLHNELGITKDKVDSLMNDYIDKKFDSKMEILMNTLYFDSKVAAIIKKQMLPIVERVLDNQLRDVNINVSMGASNGNPTLTYIHLITNETDKTVMGTFLEFLDAKKECARLVKKYPKKDFMIVESELN